ncbi:Glycerol-3-phosphate dehydrogenase [NAD(P)+] [Rickettsiales bacterium Ac37b]|nr:Glycerol-3-phosphate dehydrogenase [NAD(P)+] [Rickettsiales bacterium Ac37b]
MKRQIGVIGGGAWATALSMISAQATQNVILWTRNENVVMSINALHTNSQYLSNVTLPINIHATNNLKDILSCELIIIAIPAQSLRDIILELQKLDINTHIPLIICCKGVEQQSLLLMSEVVQEILPLQQIAVLSGPNFADEIAEGLPAATSLAALELKLARHLAENLSNHNLKIYYTDDIISVQLGGAVKNVIAIASGIITGKNLGENARAALITRSIAEIKRLCIAKGGNAETLMGLAGIGDLLLTCSSNKSRNMSFGIELSKGKSLQSIQNSGPKIVEGVISAKSIYELSLKLGIEMPICKSVYQILYESASIENTINSLLKRPVCNE